MIATQYDAWLTPAQAVERYSAWVAAGFDELERWLAAQDTGTIRSDN